jgi:two-component system phosphate regulon sensor histidine kinase PhoR
MRLKSIQSVLFISFIGIAVLSLLLFALLANPRINDAAINQISSDLYKQALLSSADYSDALQKQLSPSAIEAMAKKTASLSGNRVTVISREGMIFGDSEVPFARLNKLENHLDRPEIQQAMKSGQGKAVRYSATLGKSLIYVAVALKTPDKKLLGFLRFAVPPVYAANLTAKINRSGLAALVSAIIVAVLLSMLLARYFSQPIVRLARVARKISQGDFPQTIMLKSRFEIRKLEEAVEMMSQRLAEMFAALAAERGQVSAILASMTEGVLAVDKNNEIILVNPIMERMFGVIEPEILGKTVRMSIRNNEIADLIEEASQKSEILEKEISIITPIDRSFMAHASPLVGADRKMAGVVCVLHDITEIKKLENYRSEFVANVSHELKTPLTAIRGYVETLLGGAIEDQEHNRDFLSKIDKHASNLSALIDDILEISRLESRRERGAFIPLDLYRLVDRAVDTVSEKAKKKNIQIANHCRGEGLTIMGIEDHVYRAIVNILDNAVNYNNQSGKVTIECIKEPSSIKLIIADTGIGIGIPAKDLPRIFERFYRVDKARSREQGGTGLGLAIVKHVMNLHNGSVLVESEEEKGSKFTLSFPV